jgi:cytoplasmic iron level regulating protein YaaA (DUF328/UPF0246 family)
MKIHNPKESLEKLYKERCEWLIRNRSSLDEDKIKAFIAETMQKTEKLVNSDEIKGERDERLKQWIEQEVQEKLKAIAEKGWFYDGLKKWKLEEVSPDP